jgi:hypothetical protein
MANGWKIILHFPPSPFSKGEAPRLNALAENRPDLFVVFFDRVLI